MDRLTLASLCACLAAVSTVPTTTSLPTTDDESVARCVAEVVSGAISDGGPAPAADSCVRVLRKDERFNGFLQRKDLMQILQQLSKHARSSASPSQGEAENTGAPDGGVTRPLKSDEEGKHSLSDAAEPVQHRGEEVGEGAAGTAGATAGDLVEEEARGREAANDDDGAAVVDKGNVRGHGERRRQSGNIGAGGVMDEAERGLRRESLRRDDAAGDGGRDLNGGARIPDESSGESKGDGLAALTLSEQERNADQSERDRHGDRRAGDGRGEEEEEDDEEEDEEEEERSSREGDPRVGAPEPRGHEGKSEGEEVEEELIRMTRRNVQRKDGVETLVHRQGPTGGPDKTLAAAATRAEKGDESGATGVTPAYGDTAVAERDSATATAVRHARGRIDSEGSLGNPDGAEDRGSRAAQGSSEEELAEIAAMELELEDIVNKIEDLKRG